MHISRRDLFATSFGLAFWSEVANAQQHNKLTVLDAPTARDIEAITSQILPSGDGPGAREAGVVYFIDRALATFDSEKREDYRKGLLLCEAARQKMFPQSTSIASLSTDQQIALLGSLDKSDFFELLRTHTMYGFLANPSYGGNRGGVGWAHIGFEHRMAWTPPFGYYDAEAAK